MEKIGFIGLGHMGLPMANNLVRAGYDVTGFDLSKPACDAFAVQGGRIADSLTDIIKDADVIITMLQSGRQVEEVCLQTTGVFAHAKKNLLYIDSSSIEIDITRELHAAAKQQGIAMLDAPVSGGVAGATAATLTLMVGGSEENYSRALPMLEKLGKKIVHAGAAGSGQAAKICNNLILGISMIAVSEGFALGEKLGLDPKKFFEISSHASGQCWAMTSYCPVPGLVESAPSNRDYQPGFMAKMMLKDLKLAQRAAESAGANIPLGMVAEELYKLFVDQGMGEMDFSGIIKMIEV